MSDPDRLSAIETELVQHRELLVTLRGIAERLSMYQRDMQQTLARHGAQLATLQQTLDAVKDLLERGNGH